MPDVDSNISTVGSPSPIRTLSAVLSYTTASAKSLRRCLDVQVVRIGDRGVLPLRRRPPAARRWGTAAAGRGRCRPSPRSTAWRRCRAPAPGPPSPRRAGGGAATGWPVEDPARIDHAFHPFEGAFSPRGQSAAFVRMRGRSPKRSRAARRAASGASPRSTSSAARMSRWKASSASTSAAGSLRKRRRSRRHADPPAPRNSVVVRRHRASRQRP